MVSKCADVKKVFVPVKKDEEVQVVIEKPKFGLEIEDIACEKIKLFLQQDSKSPEEYGLKIIVKADGCSGKSYDMSLTEIQPCKDAGDKIFYKDGATVIVEKTSYMFVSGSSLGYVEALTGSGFVINNPHVKKTCSCGSSFAV